MIPAAVTRPGLERNGFYSIIPSLLSLRGNHYKGAFEDSGHVVCPEGLTRRGALLSDSGIWLHPWSLTVSLFASTSFEEKSISLPLNSNSYGRNVFSPKLKYFVSLQHGVGQPEGARGNLELHTREELWPVGYVTSVQVSTQTPQPYPRPTSQLPLGASSLSTSIISGTHIHAQICLGLSNVLKPCLPEQYEHSLGELCAVVNPKPVLMHSQRKQCNCSCRS